MKDTPNETGKKTWKNYYWFYYKWHMLAALVLVLTIVICTAQCVMKVDPDYYVLFYARNYYTDEALQEVTDELQKYSEDLNGDGKVKVMAVNCTFSDNDTQRINTVRQQALLQMTTDNTCFWVMDKSGVELYYNNDDIDIFAKPTGFSQYDSHAENADRFKGFDIMKKLNGDSEFYVFCRKSKTGTEPNKIAADVLQKIKK